MARKVGVNMRDKMWDKLWELSLCCGMNQRYYEELAIQDEAWHSKALMFLAMIPLVCFVKTAWKMSKDSKAVLICDVLVMGIALLVAVAIQAEDSGRTARLRTYWTDLRVDVDNLTKYVEGCGSEPIPDWMVRRLGDLHSRRVAVIPTEPPTDVALLNRCYEDECRGRGVDPVSKQQE